ncbi:MAG: methyltransferase domain-containing protein [Nocardioidaceae bacterium]
MSGQNSMVRRSEARTAVVWHALRAVLPASSTASVVDIGGGTGGLAVRIAELGHRVTVIDPSPDALAALGRRADESGVADLVLCHGVLEIVDDPAAALGSIAQALRPGGTLSLLVNQRHAAVVTRAMAGHFVQARALLDDPTATGGGAARRFTAEEVTALLAEAGFDTGSMHAVRVFVDLVPSSLVDLEPGAAAALVELEQAVADRPEYFPLATQLHTLATRR